MHEKLKGGTVTTSTQTGKKLHIKFLRAWWEPLVWAMGKMGWSEECNQEEPLMTQRQKSATWLEITLTVGLLTGNAIGCEEDTIHNKIAIVKQGFLEIVKKFNFISRKNSGAPGIPGKKFLAGMGKCRSAAACGFDNLPGVNRRPCFSEIPGFRILRNSSTAGIAANLLKKAVNLSESLYQPRSPITHTKWSLKKL